MKAESVCFVAGFSKEAAESIVGAVHPAGIPTTVCPSIAELLARLRTDSNGCIVVPLESVAPGAVPPVTEITARSPAVGLIFVATVSNTRNTVAAMQLHATYDVVDWPAETSRLASDVAEVLAAAGRRSDSLVKQRQARQLLDELTAGERQVLDLMAAGMPNKKVAPALGIALRTVEARRKRIFAKLGTRSLLEIARLLHATSEAVEACTCHEMRTDSPRYLKVASASA
jgi:FixJ family two-component response regulator